MSTNQPTPNFYEGKITHTISKGLIAKTNHPEHPTIELIRNQFTTKLNPILSKLTLNSEFLFSVSTNPEDPSIKIFTVKTIIENSINSSLTMAASAE